ncbi:hypothetical protein ZIOFF_053977 [Zingiber officinale]|uniref:Uncharacterized protein n=1 Tax=Zingiber officinale TaxID=94328 RepID=A0A8J5FD27_ZINOF|nr:hypothetical protein ZIOFF_053977 [Zingiber officinale]
MYICPSVLAVRWHNAPKRKQLRECLSMVASHRLPGLLGHVAAAAVDALPFATSPIAIASRILTRGFCRLSLFRPISAPRQASAAHRPR